MENHEINEHETINDLKNYCRNEYGTNDTQEDKDFIDNMGNEQSNGYNLRPCPTKWKMHVSATQTEKNQMPKTIQKNNHTLSLHKWTWHNYKELW